jgi:hypothetical protein
MRWHKVPAKDICTSGTSSQWSEPRLRYLLRRVGRPTCCLTKKGNSIAQQSASLKSSTKRRQTDQPVSSTNVMLKVACDALDALLHPSRRCGQARHESGHVIPWQALALCKLRFTQGLLINPDFLQQSYIDRSIRRKRRCARNLAN